MQALDEHLADHACAQQPHLRAVHAGDGGVDLPCGLGLPGLIQHAGAKEALQPQDDLGKGIFGHGTPLAAQALNTETPRERKGRAKACTEPAA